MWHKETPSWCTTSRELPSQWSNLSQRTSPSSPRNLKSSRTDQLSLRDSCQWISSMALTPWLLADSNSSNPSNRLRRSSISSSAKPSMNKRSSSKSRRNSTSRLKKRSKSAHLLHTLVTLLSLWVRVDSLKLLDSKASVVWILLAKSTSTTISMGSKISRITLKEHLTEGKVATRTQQFATQPGLTMSIICEEEGGIETGKKPVR